MKHARILYTLMLAGVLAVPAAAQEFRALEFRDLEDHWARDTVTEMARAGIITGDPNGTFRPDAPVTRGEMAAMLLRATGMGMEGGAPGVLAAPGVGDRHAEDAGTRVVPQPGTPGGVTPNGTAPGGRPTPGTRDGVVDDPAQLGERARPGIGDGVGTRLSYNQLQERARQMGILEAGMAPGTQATRAEVAGMAMRVLQAAGVQTPAPEAGAAFEDVPAAHRASGDILAAQSRGILQGYPDGTFRPQQPITRAEAAVVASRVREMVAAGPGRPGIGAEPVIPPPGVEGEGLPQPAPGEVPPPAPPAAPEGLTPAPADPVVPPADPAVAPADPALAPADSAPPVDPVVPRLEPEPVDPDAALRQAVAPGRRFVAGNFLGQSGNLVTPSALTLPRGVMSAGYHYLDKRIFGGGGDSMNIFSASFGFTNRLEAGIATVDRRGTRILANGKFLLVPETRSVPAISVGVVDLFDSLGNDPAAYLVIGKNLTTVSPDVAEETRGRTLRAYLGFGTGPYEGVMGGLNLTMSPRLALIAEYAPEGPLTGRTDSVNLGARFGVTDRVQLQAGLFDFDNFGVGVSFRTGLPWAF